MQGNLAKTTAIWLSSERSVMTNQWEKCKLPLAHYLTNHGMKSERKEKTLKHTIYYFLEKQSALYGVRREVMPS